MSNINTNATVTLTVNGKQAEDMLLKLKSQAANLEKAIEKAAAAGNKQQLTKLKRELKETNRQISQIENAAKGVEHVLQRLDETSWKKCTLQNLKNIFSEVLFMAFFNSAVGVLQTLVVALGAGLGIWGAINLLEGYGNDNPGANAHVR